MHRNINLFSYEKLDQQANVIRILPHHLLNYLEDRGRYGKEDVSDRMEEILSEDKPTAETLWLNFLFGDIAEDQTEVDTSTLDYSYSEDVISSQEAQAGFSAGMQAIYERLERVLTDPTGKIIVAPVNTHDLICNLVCATGTGNHCQLNMFGTIAHMHRILNHPSRKLDESGYDDLARCLEVQRWLNIRDLYSEWKLQSPGAKFIESIPGYSSPGRYYASHMLSNIKPALDLLIKGFVSLEFVNYNLPETLHAKYGKQIPLPIVTVSSEGIIGQDIDGNLSINSQPLEMLFRSFPFRGDEQYFNQDFVRMFQTNYEQINSLSLDIV